MTCRLRAKLRTRSIALALLLLCCCGVGPGRLTLASAGEPGTVGKEGSDEAALTPGEKARAADEEAARIAWERDAKGLGLTGEPVVMKAAGDFARFQERYERFRDLQKKPLPTIHAVFRRAERARTPYERMFFLTLAVDYPVHSPRDFRDVVEGIRWLEDLGQGATPELAGAALEVQASLEVVLTGDQITPAIAAEVPQLLAEETTRRSRWDRYVPMMSWWKSKDEPSIRVRTAALTALIRAAKRHDMRGALEPLRHMKGSWDKDLAQYGDYALGLLGDDEELGNIVRDIERGKKRPEIYRFQLAGAREIMARLKGPGLDRDQRKRLIDHLPAVKSRELVDYYIAQLRDDSTPVDIVEAIAFDVSNAMVALSSKDLAVMLQHKDPEVRSEGMLVLVTSALQNKNPIDPILIPLLERIQATDTYLGGNNRDRATRLLDSVRKKQ